MHQVHSNRAMASAADHLHPSDIVWDELTDRWGQPLDGAQKIIEDPLWKLEKQLCTLYMGLQVKRSVPSKIHVAIVIHVFSGTGKLFLKITALFGSVTCIR